MKDDMGGMLGGTLTEGGHTLLQRVYYEDTDFSGFVYHARYLHFLERGRTDFIRALGITQSLLADGDGLVFVVHHMDISFRRSARMDDILEIRTRPRISGRTKLTFEQDILRGGEVLIAARVDIATVNGQGRPRRIPEAVLAGLGPFAVPRETSGE